MVIDFPYLMEHDLESERLDRKTDITTVQKQALWAGLKSGMRVADIGCGSGKATHTLFQAVQPGGLVIGVDGSPQRIEYATEHYGTQGLDFICRAVAEPLADLGQFDFIWVRFFLEYHRSRAFKLVEKFSQLLKPGGIMCLVDLDHNCLNHYEMPPRLEDIMRRLVAKTEEEADFDTRMGIKLYSFLFDLGFEEIDVSIEPHHLIFGALRELDDFNWNQKLEVAAQRFGCSFDAFKGGFKGFKEEFKRFFSDPRRFTYTPVIACRGSMPSA